MEHCFPRGAFITFQVLGQRLEEPLPEVLQTATPSPPTFSFPGPTLVHLCSRPTAHLYLPVFHRLCDASGPFTQQFPLPRTSSVLLLPLHNLFYCLGLCLSIVSSKNPSLTLEDGVRCHSGVLTPELHLTPPVAPITVRYSYLFSCLFGHNGTY